MVFSMKTYLKVSFEASSDDAGMSAVLDDLRKHFGERMGGEDSMNSFAFPRTNISIAADEQEIRGAIGELFKSHNIRISYAVG